VTHRLRRLISGSLIVVLTLFSAGVVCVLPCGVEADATAAPDATPDTHCLKATPSGTMASVAASNVSCSDRDGLSPTIGNSVRRIADAAGGDMAFAARDYHAVLIHSIGPIITSSPPGCTAIPISVPLRI
jgi:hypothetical protein